MTEADQYYRKVVELIDSGTPFVSVSLVDGVGSIPGAVGCKMLVTDKGWLSGTVGGGKLEKKAIDLACQMLADPDPERSTSFVNWSLSKDVGMTCGGSVKLYFERHATRSWTIVIFGAGHVASAVIKLLLGLECSVVCVDPRREWLDKLPDSPKLTKKLTENMVEEVAQIPDEAFVLLMTMGHSTDSPILVEILKQRSFPYLGVIGSQAKRARLKQDLLQAGLSEQYMNKFFCPIGLEIGSNSPSEIAISVAAQLLQIRSKCSAKL